MNEQQAYSEMRKLLDENTDDEYIANFLRKADPEKVTAKELVGFCRAIRDSPGAVSIRPDVEMLADTCGTGGDMKGTFNVSTAAAIIAASAGIPIAKHGNYGVTSRCGSADVLKELGYDVRMPPERCNEMIEDENIGFAFLLASDCYPAMKRVAVIRERMKKKTVFNITGPLNNPANAGVRLLGVFIEPLCEKLCYALEAMGVKKAMVVHGSGLDEISNIGNTRVCMPRDSSVYSYIIRPEDMGFGRCRLEDISGGSAKENAVYLKEILEGKKGPRRDIALMNAGAVVSLAYGSTFREGIEVAAKLVDSGKALERFGKILEYQKMSRK